MVKITPAVSSCAWAKISLNDKILEDGYVIHRV